MRKSTVSILALTLIIAVMLIPSASYASGGEAPKCAAEAAQRFHDNEITEAQFEEEAIDCLSAPSPVFPEINEIVWGTLAFAIVAGGLIKFGFPSIKKGLQAREDKIREDLESAETAKQEALAKSKDYDDKLKDARAQATRIIDEAKEQAGVVKAELVSKAEEEAATIRAKAHNDAEQIASRALDDIKGQVAELSIDLAEKVVKNSLDKKVQLDLVNSYIKDLDRVKN